MRTNREGPTPAVIAPVITFFSAAWNCSISGVVPTVMRVQFGHTGQMRPMCTFSPAIASMTCFAGLFTSSMKQLVCDGM